MKQNAKITSFNGGINTFFLQIEMKKTFQEVNITYNWIQFKMKVS